MSAIESQMLAGLRMLKDCIERCPATEWDKSHGDYPFSQVLFHALFDCDYNLSKDNTGFRDQVFHKANRERFGDYEELKDSRTEKVYDMEFIQKYYEHCIEKITATFNAGTADNLLIANSDIYGNMTKMERYINSIRHIQHHAAQLGLRLQYATGKEMDWQSRG